MKSKGLILLSGGLDSLVSLALAKDEYNIELALTFDYGQVAFEKELAAALKICEFYKIKHRIVALPWLKELLSEGVWVPNRNALFLNIAGCFADSEKITYIIFGANKQEAVDFIDNSIEFVERVNGVFEFSTQNSPIVLAPLLELDKSGIIKLALEYKVPLELIYSCYGNGDKNCGQCPSCKLLKAALVSNNAQEYLEVLF